MIRVDKDTGSIIWAFQPVPFKFDGDPDWAAGAMVMSTSCGELIASVQKDGWSYALNAGNGTPGTPNVRWQFPPTGFPFTSNTYVHGDDDYKRPGAAWIGDPRVVPGIGYQCSNIDFTGPFLCNLFGYALVPIPKMLADVAMPDGGGIAGLRNEPALAKGRVFVGTLNGHVYMLEP
jgi:outer membrane protein assembly factor BamB